jgi:hypothetical protein
MPTHTEQQMSFIFDNLRGQLARHFQAEPTELLIGKILKRKAVGGPISPKRIAFLRGISFNTDSDRNAVRMRPCRNERKGER